MKYAVVFMYGGSPTICEWANTFMGAERKAKKCEGLGGVHHEIWEVRKYRPAPRKRP